MMFYTQLFTSTRGPLAKIWLAAHWERKLTKTQVFECNLETVIRDIISPKMKIGLRTSGHLLIGVVRIYSRKAKYLLADCVDALAKVKNAFRPGQTDLAVEELEAQSKAITLIEDFTGFDPQLPDPSNIDVVDHFTLNQSRSEEITLKEDFGNEFLTLVDFGDESHINQTGLLDMSLHSLSHHGDAFGDEDKGFDLLDFLANPSDHIESTDLIPEEPQNENPETPKHPQDDEKIQMQTPTLSESTLLLIEDKAFALEPVPITPNSQKKRGKRKRCLIVDQTKELSNDSLRGQISDFSDLVVAVDLAPPTRQLMLWKESGGADKLLAQPCSTVLAPQINELFSHSMKYGISAEVEVMRQDEQEGQIESSALSAENISIVNSSLDCENTHSVQLMIADHTTDRSEYSSSHREDKEWTEVKHPELPSQESTFVHPPFTEEETQSSSFNTQSMLCSQVFEDRRISRCAQKLLSSLKSNSSATLSLKALCDGCTRSQAATTFFCLLVLHKQRSLRLYQSKPYEDIYVTPGPKISD